MGSTQFTLEFVLGPHTIKHPAFILGDRRWQLNNLTLHLIGQYKVCLAHNQLVIGYSLHLPPLPSKYEG